MFVLGVLTLMLSDGAAVGSLAASPDTGWVPQALSNKPVASRQEPRRKNLDFTINHALVMSEELFSTLSVRLDAVAVPRVCWESGEQPAGFCVILQKGLG